MENFFLNDKMEEVDEEGRRSSERREDGREGGGGERKGRIRVRKETKVRRNKVGKGERLRKGREEGMDG